MRYEAQEYTLTIPIDGADDRARTASSTRSPRRFHEAHDARYGHSNPGAPIEFVVVRTTALGDLGRAEPERAVDRRRSAPTARAP